MPERMRTALGAARVRVAKSRDNSLRKGSYNKASREGEYLWKNGVCYRFLGCPE